MQYVDDVRRVISRPDTVACLEQEKARANNGGTRPDSLDLALALAADNGLHVKTFDGIGENGKPATFYLIGARLNTMRHFLQLHDARDTIPRRNYQAAMGQLYGYSRESIAEFSDSDTGKRCPCSLCGRDDIKAAMRARRVQPWGAC